MRKSEAGFSHVVLLAVVVVLAIACSGYVVYVHQHNKVTPATTAGTAKTTASGLAMPTNTSNTVSGVTSAINSLATSLTTNEVSLNSQANASDQSSDANVGTAATNLGGAYDANNY